MLNPTLIDTHCHLDADAFGNDLPEVISAAVSSGVQHMLTIGISLDTSRAAVAVAEKFPEVSAVVGIQPNYAAEARAGDWDAIVELTSHPQVVAIGETGLDRYWDFAPMDIQRDYFVRHLELSRRCGKPFVVHCREAEADVLEVLRSDFRHGPLNGVMHSFCGDAATAEECISMGMYISFAGMVTYKRNNELRQTAAGIPADRLLVETDAPYLAPEPRRGKRNEPSWVRFTAARLAEVRGVPEAELAEYTTRNAQRLFGLNGPHAVSD